MTHPSQKPYKKIRVVVECMAPDDMTEADLLCKLKEIIKWPIQLSREKGRRDTIVRPKFKRFSRVLAYERARVPSWLTRAMDAVRGEASE